ncbi:MAG: 16S rRNA (cytidine(1402)-2'-O)-methyltransferase [Vicinamibacterales bacterium]
MPGILYVVATPIGNLEDLTFRALRVLRDVALIAAEDTRRTARLLQHYSISTRTTSLHEHNERAKVPGLIARLQAGDSVALVSDAGTPLISDPGVLLVSAAHAAGIRVEPVPGASAALAAVSASGLAADEILFVGFPPSRSNARKKWFQRLSAEQRLVVFFEAPHRIRAALEDARQIWGERTIAVGRELTKVHEQLVIRPISEQISGLGEPRGEFTVVVAPALESVSGKNAVPDPAVLAGEFGRLTEIGQGNRRQILRELAERYQVAPKEMYRLLEKGRKDLA